MKTNTLIQRGERVPEELSRTAMHSGSGTFRSPPHQLRTTPGAVRPNAGKNRLRARPRDASRVLRLQRAAVIWGVWTILITALWVAHEQDANGTFQRFGHEGEPGQWNPTLWAFGIGFPTLIVGIMALAVYFVPSATDPTALDVPRLRFHAAAWLFGMIVLTPLWALIEWQDNGGFERWSTGSQPGDWDPWILTVGGVWAVCALGLCAVRYVLGRINGVDGGDGLHPK